MLHHGTGGMRGSGQSDLDEMSRGKTYDHRVVIRTIRYILPYKKEVLLAILGMLAYSSVTAAIPWLIKTGIDEYILLGDLDGLNIIALVFGILLCVHFIANYSHLLLLERIGQQVLLDLRTELFSYLQKQSMTFYNRFKVGQIMSRSQNDVQALNEFINILTGSLADIFSLIGIIVVMIVMDPILALISFGLTPFMILALSIWQRYARPAFLGVRAAISRVNGLLQENLSGVRVIQSMNRHEQNMKSFNNLNRSYLRAQLKATRLSSGVMPLMEVFTGLALASIVVFGGQLVLNKEIEVGVLVAFALFIQRFFDPIRMLTMQYSGLQRAMAAGDRIFELLDTPIDLIDKDNALDIPPIAGKVEYKGVSFHYQSGQPVIRNVNLTVEPGEMVAFVGATGAGKTTIVGLLSRFFDVTEGQIMVDGHDIRDITRDSLAKQTGMVLQEPFLFSGTIGENIRYRETGASQSQVELAAQSVGLHDFIVGLPQGYDSILEERGGNLSFGQRQLISFARALVANPRILILDEATASVDTETEQMIQQAISNLLVNRTSFVIAHRLSTIENADKIVVMEQGEIIETGTHAQLLALNGTYNAYYTQYQDQTG